LYHLNLREILAQTSDNEAVELLQQTLRQSIRLALFDAMKQEVNFYSAELITSPQIANTSEQVVSMGASI